MKKIIYSNYLIKIVLILGGIFFSIPTIMNKDLYGSLIRISIILLALLPDILRKRNIKITEKIEFIYLLLLFTAHFLGSIVNLYHKISWYDTLVHYISGLIVCLFGYFIYIKGKGSKNKYLEFLFLLSFSALVAFFWESFEFIFDQLFGKDAQNVKTTGVVDTMEDMIVALLGTFTVQICAYLEKKYDKKLFISHFIQEMHVVYGKSIE